MMKLSLVLLSVSLAVALDCRGGNESDAQAIGQAVTNLVQHANASDTAYFKAVMEPTSASQAPQLIAMVKKSDMLANYTTRLESETATQARLNYHDTKRGCHFQVQLQKADAAWKVTRIWFCR